MQLEKFKDFIKDKADDLKANDITELDLREKSTFTEYMLVCSGNSKQHVKSIARHVADEAKQEQIRPYGIEGEDVGEWVLVDFGEVVLHVMTEEMRDLYQLEKLWQQ
ncbi:ribosome silencing factor [Gayadomonas joobiniege]|uniref:ribosome silencing factor n=1 Tax=Gayadomonas joobiniege TaxID=1234606 RepID=UPI00035D67B4|nr:ribosome silencing factor [Gayadomonas joobiniege]